MPSGRRAAAACLLVAGLFVLPAPPAGASDGAPWSLAPATSGGSRPAADGRPYFYLEGEPGSVLEDTVTVTNEGDEPRTVRLRGADADNTGDGGLSVTGGARAKGSGAWITPARRKVTVPARTRAEVPFSMTVPADATPGDHPAAVVADGSGRETGVRVHLRVSGPTLSALTVEDVEAGSDSIAYSLVNRGNTVLRPKLAVRADGVLGRLVDRPARALPVELLPGRRVELTEPWKDAPALDSAQVRLTVTAGGGARDSATAEVRFVPWPAVAAVGGVLLLAAVAATGFVRSRRRAGEQDTDDPAPDAEARVPQDEDQLVTAGAGPRGGPASRTAGTGGER
ncbi:hypothetical protein DSC45_19560 [Streptomyces sp. YIM 130001]|uniref:COG1470 family protein n=1 Tax=Streptomyces sp. YIM 130001 TaxID=2259644 RepID=UPI000E659CF7|nr:hypothetical protein [Streptomyces sp. YIM 130001]RII15095.1 hypothetical protein DSC45_19560 [Streptomyces sp. YIM 130001]